MSGGGYAGEFMLPGVVNSLGAAPASRGGLPIATVAPAAAQPRAQPAAAAVATDAAAPAPICAANAWLQLD